MLTKFASDGYRLVGGAESRAYVRRRLLSLLVVVFLLSTSALLWTAITTGRLRLPWTYQVPPPGTHLPPLYSQYHTAELELPQHNWSHTRPGEDERFFFVAGHVRGLGWGNALQEHLLDAYLAYRSRRTFVFNNYTWKDDGSLYSTFKTNWIPSQIPYTAIIRGPPVGAPFPTDDDTPPAVAETYFNHICPYKVEKNVKTVHASLATEGSVDSVIQTWSDLLTHTSNPCVQSTRRSGSIFTHNQIFGVRGSLLDIWPGFSSSPLITHFGWSALVESAFDHNRHHFLPASSEEPFLTSTPFTTNAERYPMIPGLMVLHVRRGDYLEHCTFLAETYEDFVSVNNFPNMPDAFTVPERVNIPRNVKTSPEHLELYRQRCFPSVDEIAKKVAEVRATPSGSDLRKVYIMTNGDKAFINELKVALWDVGEWEAVSSSRDLVLDWEQKFVAQAVDQLVAQRAQVLVGNGFSTLTSNAVMMRLANGLDVESNRFW